MWAADCGPKFYEYDSFEAMAACLLAFLSMGSGRNLTDCTAWKFKYGRWVPAFGYHPGASVAEVIP